MKTKEPTLKQRKDIGKKVSPLVNSIITTLLKHDLDDDVFINVCLAMTFRAVQLFEIEKTFLLKIIDKMYKDLENEKLN